MDQPILAARIRTDKKKGAARRLRAKGAVPAIYYGPDTEPMALSVEAQGLRRLLSQGKGEALLVDLQIESEKGPQTKKALLKEVQLHPVCDRVLHADFYGISKDREITVEVPLRMVGTPIGVTKGGILETVRREMTVSCLPDSLVDSIEVDVSNLDIGGALHVHEIAFPEGITPVEEGHLTVAVVAAPEAEEAPIEEELEPTEGETPELA